jgi:hypothetical protein
MPRVLEGSFYFFRHAEKLGWIEAGEEFDFEDDEIQELLEEHINALGEELHGAKLQSTILADANSAMPAYIRQFRARVGGGRAAQSASSAPVAEVGAGCYASLSVAFPSTVSSLFATALLPRAASAAEVVSDPAEVTPADPTAEAEGVLPKCLVNLQNMSVDQPTLIHLQANPRVVLDGIEASDDEEDDPPGMEAMMAAMMGMEGLGGMASDLFGGGSGGMMEGLTAGMGGLFGGGNGGGGHGEEGHSHGHGHSHGGNPCHGHGEGRLAVDDDDDDDDEDDENDDHDDDGESEVGAMGDAEMAGLAGMLTSLGLDPSMAADPEAIMSLVEALKGGMMVGGGASGGGGSGHGHSHGGAPCHGHGHGHPNGAGHEDSDDHTPKITDADDDDDDDGDDDEDSGDGDGDGWETVSNDGADNADSSDSDDDSDGDDSDDDDSDGDGPSTPPPPRAAPPPAAPSDPWGHGFSRENPEVFGLPPPPVVEAAPEVLAARTILKPRRRKRGGPK